MPFMPFCDSSPFRAKIRTFTRDAEPRKFGERFDIEHDIRYNVFSS